jgi:hypothetical protein
MIHLIVISILLVVFGFQIVTDPEPTKTTWQIIWQIVIPIIAGLYEVIVRIIPTFKNYSVINKAIEILLWLSQFFNRNKKK